MCFGRAFHLILMHLLCYIQCFKISFQKNQVFSLKICFFQNFNWSNLIFDQSKSCFKNSVSLCLVRLIEPIFQSIEDRISGFLNQFFDCFKTYFLKRFFNFSSLSNLERIHYNFFCRFPPSKPVRPFYPSFCFYFRVFMHIFMHLKGLFGPLYFWDFWWFNACFLKLIIGFCWDIVIFMIVVN